MVDVVDVPMVGMSLLFTVPVPSCSNTICLVRKWAIQYSVLEPSVTLLVW